MNTWFARQAYFAGVWAAGNQTGQAGPVAVSAGVLGGIAGTATAVRVQPITRTITVALKDDAGNLLLNQVCKIYSEGGLGVADVYKGSQTSDAATGVLVYAQTLILSDFVPLYITGTYTVGAVEFTYRSEMLTPA